MSGEKEDDDLGWLISPVLSNLDPKEQVGDATKPPHQAVQFPFLPVLSDHQVRHLENESELEIVDNNNVDSLVENENEIVGTNNHEWQGNEKASYTLSPRTT